MDLKMPSAIVERQMLPRHTNRILIGSGLAMLQTRTFFFQVRKVVLWLRNFAFQPFGAKPFLSSGSCSYPSRKRVRGESEVFHILLLSSLISQYNFRMGHLKSSQGSLKFKIN